MTISNRDNWDFGYNPMELIENKELMFKYHILNILNKTVRMFEYKNLPETIEQKDLETQLQLFGFCIWKKVLNPETNKEEWYTFYGGLGGKPNPYYLPTIAVVANPALRYTENLKIDENCVVMRNDNYYLGIVPVISKYASLIIEGEITLKYALLNARIPSVFQADNDTAYETAKEIFEGIYNGDTYNFIMKTKSLETFEGTKQLNFSNNENKRIIEIIEAIQYNKGSEYNELGLNAAFNMKREAINEAEASLNDDILMPYCETMLLSRREALKKLNEMYGLEIEVDFSSAWKRNVKNEELAEQKIESEIKENIGGDDNEKNEVTEITDN